MNLIQTVLYEIFTFRKQFFCRHRNVYFIRNIYGDEILRRSGRSEHACGKCAARVYLLELRSDEIVKRTARGDSFVTVRF